MWHVKFLLVSLWLRYAMALLRFGLLWLRLQFALAKPTLYFYLAPLLYLFTHRRIPVKTGCYILADRRVPIAAIRRGMAIAHKELALVRPGTVLIYDQPTDS